MIGVKQKCALGFITLVLFMINSCDRNIIKPKTQWVLTVEVNDCRTENDLNGAMLNLSGRNYNKSAETGGGYGQTYFFNVPVEVELRLTLSCDGYIDDTLNIFLPDPDTNKTGVIETCLEPLAVK